MSLTGIRTVASLELLQRRRASRWPVVLGVWVAVLGAASVLTWVALDDDHTKAGHGMYDLTTFLVLGLGLLVVPALTSTSVNGDREQGVLASLQTTLLTPADIVLGKLAASWVVALVFLATALPFLVWGWVAGGIGIEAALGSLLVLALVLGVVCAIGLMFSTLTARPVGSAVLTYLSVAFLVIGTLLVFALSMPLVMQKEQRAYYGIPQGYWDGTWTPSGGAGQTPTAMPSSPDQAPPDPHRSDCRHLTREEDVVHTERTWGLLAVNPFVVVADAAPGRSLGDDRQNGFTPMRWIAIGAREARAGADVSERQECWYDGTEPDYGQPPRDGGPVWPYGLAGLLLVGAGATAVVIRRVRTPMTALPNGTRVA